MQKHSVKNIALILILLFVAYSVPAQVSHFHLQKADSLFGAKRYTQALAQYEGVIANKEYTPSLLLKMAYIHEALGHIAQTQYFLNLYFLSTYDNSVLDKMEELATKHGLEGYQLTDKDRFIGLYDRYQSLATILLTTLIIVCLGWTIRTKQTHKKPVVAFSMLVIVCVLLVTHLQFSSSHSTSILIQPNTYLMSGPSAGADVVEILDAGHKLRVIGKKDVWLRVLWHDQDAYLKEDVLQPVSL